MIYDFVLTFMLVLFNSVCLFFTIQNNEKIFNFISKNAGILGVFHCLLNIEAR